jgi:hypothetical protein
MLAISASCRIHRRVMLFALFLFSVAGFAERAVAQSTKSPALQAVILGGAGWPAYVAPDMGSRKGAALGALVSLGLRPQAGEAARDGSLGGRAGVEWVRLPTEVGDVEEWSAVAHVLYHLPAVGRQRLYAFLGPAVTRERVARCNLTYVDAVPPDCTHSAFVGGGSVGVGLGWADSPVTLEGAFTRPGPHANVLLVRAGFQF